MEPRCAPALPADSLLSKQQSPTKCLTNANLVVSCGLDQKLIDATGFDGIRISKCQGGSLRIYKKERNDGNWHM